MERSEQTSARERVFFHVDLDAFYASVEQSENEELRGKPVIVGALPGSRGVVSACSYEARTFGIHSAMPISQAYRRCPQGIYLVPRMRRYQEISKMIMGLLKEYSPAVYQISIDEATLDMTGTERLFGAPEKIAGEMKANVRDRHGITLSIGIAPNRYLAKLASEADKPDGLLRVFADGVETFLDSLGLEELWGVGQTMLNRLDELSIHTVSSLRSYPLEALAELVGNAAGSYLYRVCRGDDPGMYGQTPKSRSISAESTFAVDTRDRETILRVLLDLSHQVMFRMIDEGFRSKTIHFKVRFGDFTTRTSNRTLGHYVASAEELHKTCSELFETRWSGGEQIRLIGVGLASLEKSSEPQQESLFENAYDRKRRVEEIVLDLQKKHRETRVVKASLLNRRRRWE